MKFQLMSGDNGSLSENSSGTVIWSEQILCVAIERSTVRKVLIFRKFLITTLTESQSGSTTKEAKDTSVIQY